MRQSYIFPLSLFFFCSHQPVFVFQVIQINQDPLFLSGDVLSQNEETSVWTKPLLNGNYAVIFFNAGSRHSHKKIQINWTDLGWSSNSTANVRDVWAHENVGEFTGGFETTVPGHDIFMFIAQQVD